ncbi:MAG: MoxR family ATPase [Pseudomonadota bacterium]
MNPTQHYLQQIQSKLGERVFGLGQAARLLGMTRIAGGHALLEGPPGIGKTLLARSFAQALGGQFRRVQGTPDLLPADITGVTVFRPDGTEFKFRPGPLFADVVLVDEINRAGPKTQAALLEAMEEKRTTIDGDTRELPADFVVIATQNPIDFEGTYPLPESQVDRFLIRLDLTYAPRAEEVQVLQRYASPEGSAHQDALAAIEDERSLLRAARDEVAATRIEQALVEYVVNICEATRQAQSIALGLSTRAARAMLLMARVLAAGSGFDFVRPDDVQGVVDAVGAHRIVLTPEARIAGLTAQETLSRLVEGIAVPRVQGAVPSPTGESQE